MYFFPHDFIVASFRDVTPVDHHNLTGDKALDTLRGAFNCQQFRGCQQESIQSVLSGLKHSSYQPAVMEQRITVVIFRLWFCCWTKLKGCHLVD